MKRKTILTLLALVAWAAGVSAAEVPRFSVSRYQVEGNTILTEKELTEALSPYTGKDADFGTLQQALETLEKLYRVRGFHAVRALLPEQELQGGVVRIVVNEARVGTVKVEGNSYFSYRNIRAAVPELNEGSVPNLDRISMNLRVANENPARKTQLLLQSNTDSAKVDALLKVSDSRPWSVGATVANTGTKATGMNRLGLSLQHANLFNLDHLATFQYTTSFEHPKKVNIYTLGYRAPLYRLGDSIDLYGGYSDVDSGAVQSGILDLDVSGKGTFAGIRYNQNLVRKGTYEQRLIYGIDYRRYANDILLFGNQFGTTTESLPLSIGYTGSGSFTGNSEYNAWVALSRNIPVTGSGKTADHQKARSDASANFTILRAGGTALYRAPADFHAKFNFTGQYTWKPLIPGEQFGVGGENSVRGFGERELADDIGVAGSFEVYSPDMLAAAKQSGSFLRALVFYDVGYLERLKAQPGEAAYRSAASAGAGLRLAAGRNLSASTDYAYVLNPEGSRTIGSSRWHFRINLSF